ncbi:hypothetical protein [Hymenobacter sp. CRA2]|uniref:hypothetical protein n=1 Tax=Hymenobacter sp. CRA2 TaxID=1955620 RepID=UPI00098F28D0|nr:hypothetical protein [Hymenobacter sp. CRA2]OON67519.1 hypothetical protein B0919_16950 [Hymenobacter sp. CRA2]
MIFRRTWVGVALPNAVVADVRVVQFDMVYSTDPIANEYTEGAQLLLQSAFDGDKQKVATDALDVVTTVLNNIIGSGSVQTGAQFESTKTPVPNADGSGQTTTYVSACYSVVEEASAQDWATQENFYVSYYALVVWAPGEEDLARFKATR